MSTDILIHSKGQLNRNMCEIGPERYKLVQDASVVTCTCKNKLKPKPKPKQEIRSSPNKDTVLLPCLFSFFFF